MIKSADDYSQWTDLFTATCDDYENKFDWCENGLNLQPREEFEQFTDSQGRTALDACCACGGGIKPDIFVTRKQFFVFSSFYSLNLHNKIL